MAMVIDSRRFSIIMHVIVYRRSIDFVEQIRREDLPGRPKAYALATQAQYVSSVLVYHRQLVRDEEHP